MIKTLRITSIIAVILAAGLFVVLGVFGFRGDEGIEKFLNSPGAVEKFKQAKGRRPTRGSNQVSPLVQQAEAFALYLNPPARGPIRDTRPPARGERPREIPKPPASSAKFTVIATSFQESAPELSLALIDEPGKGRHWVRQSNVVNHLTIEQIKDGVVVVRGSKGTVEIPVEQRAPRRSLLAGSSPVSAAPGGPAEPVSAAVLPSTPAGSVAAGAARPVASKSKRPVPSTEEIEQAEAMAEKMFSQMDGKGDIDFKDFNFGRRGEQDAQSPEQAQPDLRSMRITGDEAKRLDRLGRELSSVRQDPGRTPDGASGGDRLTRADTRRDARKARRNRAAERRAQMVKERIERAKALAARRKEQQAESDGDPNADSGAE
ncbi:MAG: hypothetical protein ACYTEQ_13080 [Planctomycetota bacterium]|jgi:hypothetical protein